MRKLNNKEFKTATVRFLVRMFYVALLSLFIWGDYMIFQKRLAWPSVTYAEVWSIVMTARIIIYGSAEIVKNAIS